MTYQSPILNEAFAEIGGTLDDLAEMLRENGAFGGEAGCEAYTLLRWVRQEVDSLDKRLDPARTSVTAAPSQDQPESGAVVVAFRPRAPRGY